jgi:hypothetical protein
VKQVVEHGGISQLATLAPAMNRLMGRVAFSGEFAIENLDAKRGVATFRGPCFEACFYLALFTIGLSAPGFALFGRPPLRSRAVLFQMLRATFRDRPK